MKRLHLPVVDLEDLTVRLLDLYPGPAVRNVLSLDVPLLAVPLLALVDHGLPPEQSTIDRQMERLLDCTMPGAVLDPQLVGTDVVWARLVARRLDLEPALARSTAVAWAVRIDHLSMANDHIAHAVVAAVSCYAMSAAEEALGRPVRARRWAREAACMTDHEDIPGLSLAVYLRAMTLLRSG